MVSCTSAIASMVDFIGSVVTLVWYMVVFYGLWKLKDVRYEAPVIKQKVSDLQKVIEELKEDLRYEVASTRRLAGMPPTLKLSKKEWIVGSDEWFLLDEESKDAILTYMRPV